MDLERFPTSESAKRMMSYVSSNFYDKSYCGKWIYQVMGLELDDARKKYEELALQPFAETATWGLIYHELKYGIVINPEDSLKERRKEVIRRRDFRSPMNPARLEHIITGITGTQTRVFEDVLPYIFEIQIMEPEEVTELNYAAVREMVRMVKPSHLSFFICGHFLVMTREDVLYDNRVMLRSMIYPRVNRPLMLDGSWKLDGTFQLTGIKDNMKVELYPLSIAYIAFFTSGCGSCSNSMYRAEVMKQISASTSGIWASNILAQKSYENVMLNDSCVECKKSYDSTITVEKDLWYLSGECELDGSRFLDAEIIIYDEEE